MLNPLGPLPVPTFPRARRMRHSCCRNWRLWSMGPLGNGALPSGWSSRSHSNCSVSRVTFIYIYNMLWPHLCLVLLGLQRDPSFHPSFPFFSTRALCQCEAEFSDESVTRLDLFSCPFPELVLCRSSERCEAQYNFLSNEAVLITWPKTFQNQNKTTTSYCNNHLQAFHGLWHPSAETLGQSTREHLHCKLWRMEKLPVCCADTTGSSERRFRREKMDPDWSDPVKCWPKDHISYHLISKSWSDILHTLSLHVPLYVLMGSDGRVCTLRTTPDLGRLFILLRFNTGAAGVAKSHSAGLCHGFVCREFAQLAHHLEMLMLGCLKIGTSPIYSWENGFGRSVFNQLDSLFKIRCFRKSIFLRNGHIWWINPMIYHPFPH